MSITVVRSQRIAAVRTRKPASKPTLSPLCESGVAETKTIGWNDHGLCL
jgi:hypothetical protein